MHPDDAPLALSAVKLHPWQMWASKAPQRKCLQWPVSTGSLFASVEQTGGQHTQ